MKAYISIPASDLDVGPERYHQITQSGITALIEAGFKTVRCWDRRYPSCYSSTWIKEADVVIFALPNNGFRSRIDDLPSGCKKELRRAMTLGKEIYIVYQVKDGSYKFYKADVKSGPYGWIEGVSGSSGSLLEFVNQKSEETSPKSEEKKSLNQELDYIWLAL